VRQVSKIAIALRERSALAPLSAVSLQQGTRTAYRARRRAYFDLLFNLGAGMRAAIAVKGNTPQIRAENIRDGDLLAVRDVTDDGEVPFAAHDHARWSPLQ
jgi:hypothetical protein